MYEAECKNEDELPSNRESLFRFVSFGEGMDRVFKPLLSIQLIGMVVILFIGLTGLNADAVLYAPLLSSPQNKKVLKNQIPYVFDWSDVSGAAKYRIYVDNNSGFGSPEINPTSLPTTSTYTSYSQLSDNVYYWQVQALDASNNPGAWSGKSEFVLDTPPPSPSLSAPSSGMSFQQGENIPFSWSGPSGYPINRYYLRIVAGTDLNAAPIYQNEFNGLSDSVSTSGWAAGTYTWGVRAIKTAPPGYEQLTYESAIGWGNYAQTRTITISVPLSAPNLVSPSDYQILHNKVPYNFDWTDVVGASGYRIYVDNNSGFGTPEINTTTTGSNLSWVNGIIDGVYYWQVQAKDGDGTWYDWSTPRQIVLDTPPPVATIGAPENSTSHKQGAVIPFSWSGPSGYPINRYYLRIVAGTDLNATPIYQNEFNGLSDSVSTSGWAAGTYTWGVRAIKTAPPGYNQLTYESAIGWGDYATRTIIINEQLPDLSLSIGDITTNVLQGSSIQVNCTVNRTGGSLPDPGTYVRVYLYVNQTKSLTGAQLVCGDACAFDFSKSSLAGGTEARSKDLTIPSNIKGPYYIIAVVDGPKFWSESDETNNLASSSSPVSVWQPGTPPTDEAMGVLARTWDNPDVYWIKYGKKWPFLDQATFYGLGYSDVEIGWYEATALDSFPLGKTLLKDNESFVYRYNSNPTVYLVRNGKSDWFFNWDAFVNSQFGSNDVYWAKDSGATWIQSIYPLGQLIGLQPKIRIQPDKLFLIK
jgi:hypothetical protein